MKKKVLNLVKARLGISTSVRDEYLEAIIEGVVDDFENRIGIEVDEHDFGHLMLIVDLATFRYENKGVNVIPNHLRIRLNNLMLNGR